MTGARECLRGCRTFDVAEDGTRTPKHWAACTDTECRGCVVREAADGALICAGCLGRARRLVSDAPELLERVRSKTDPRTRRDGGENQRTRPAHPPHVIDADHLDAIMAVEQVIGADVDWLANQDSGVEWLSELILDRHKPAPDGTRESWSVQDVMDRWGLEDKPEPHRYVFPDDEPDAEVALPVREWFDPLLDVKQAAKQAGVTVRAVQKWVKEGRLTPVARLRAGDGNVHTYFRASDIENTNHADGGL